MNDREREHIRTRLMEEREATIRTLTEFDERFKERFDTGDDDLSNYPLHLADEGTDTIEQEKEFLLASQEGRQFLDMNEALRTLYREPEQFGRCQECGGEIAMERLEMVPWARLCVDCKTAAEAGQDIPAA